MRHDGKTVAVDVGLGYKDEEDLRLEASREFWEMIRERRKQPTRPLRELEAELFADENDE